MARHQLKINEVKRLYLSCSNNEKEVIIDDCINKLKALTYKPEVENESKEY